MTKNLRIIFDNAHDAATLTATSEASDNLLIENTQRPGRSYVWRSLDTEPQVITASFNSPTAINAVVIYQHNLTALGRVRIEYLLDSRVVFDSGNLIASELIPLGVWRAGVDPWGGDDLTELPNVQLSVWTPDRFVDSYRITIDDSSNPAGFIQVARIVAGPAYSPVFNASYNPKLDWVDSAEHKRTESGSINTINGNVYRRLTIDLDYLDALDRSKLTRQVLKRGKGADLYISLFPEMGGMTEAEHEFLARRENDYGHTHNYFNNWQNQLVFIEV